MIPRKLILLCCMLAISIMPHTNLWPQTPEIERLKEVLNKEQGEVKLDAYSELSFHFFRTDPVKGIYYGNKAL